MGFAPEAEKVIALAGNPNVGKSTLFNRLTGLKQHTGNWPGKTVAHAEGHYRYHGVQYMLVDVPGAYSLMAHSAEEEVARDFICFGGADVVVVVCDATCLERNLNLVLQTLEMTKRVVVCINLMDEARKKEIEIDFSGLEGVLGVPVVGTDATNAEGLDALMKAVEGMSRVPGDRRAETLSLIYPDEIEHAVTMLEPSITGKACQCTRWIALRLLEGDQTLLQALWKYTGFAIGDGQELSLGDEINKAWDYLHKQGISRGTLSDLLVSSLVLKAEDICRKVVSFREPDYNAMDRKLDRLLTGRMIGIPVMILLLAFVLWLTIAGSNYPSQLLSHVLFSFQDQLLLWIRATSAPEWVGDLLIMGIYRVAAWVVAVMLPPMAIFFPLFTLLEDLGYLPRVAFNLDHFYKKSCACGKQALTMCMGFGCNAAGVVGCRIIDSPRERLLAIITNSFVPCNGRFPLP